MLGHFLSDKIGQRIERRREREALQAGMPAIERRVKEACAPLETTAQPQSDARPPAPASVRRPEPRREAPRPAAAPWYEARVAPPPFAEPAGPTPIP